MISRVRAGSTGMTDDTQEIRTLIERWADAVHGGDLDVVLAELTHHGSRTYLAPELGRA